MTHAPYDNHLTGPAVLVRAFSSLTRRDAAAVRATVRLAGGGYAVHEHDDYDGYLSLILSPAEETSSAFLVSGRAGNIDLSELRGDDMRPIHRGLPSIGAGMILLRRAIETQAARVAPRA